MDRLIRISPDGKELLYLYDDKIPKVGRLECKRASDVVFEEETQQWVVEYKIKHGKVRCGGFDTREEAIQHEIWMMENVLANYPEAVNHFMEEESWR